MYSPSIFSEMLKLLPRDIVSAEVKAHGSDRWTKSFFTWDHLVSMLAAQMSGAGSLRELEAVFNQRKLQQYHLNFSGIKRSTLGDANQSRSAGVFAGIARGLMARQRRGKSRQMRELLAVLDSSPINLNGRGLEWARVSRMRHYNQGLKLHLLFTPEAEEIDYAHVTLMTVNDVIDGRNITVEEGRIYVFDKGYYDYNWWHDLTGKGAHFVTRLKVNAAYKVLESREIDDTQGLIIADQLITLTNKKPRAGQVNHLAGTPLRLVTIKHSAGKKQPFIIVTDMLDASAMQIADWYKQRWSIELMFKWIKQNLKIKRFMGASANAIMIQIYVAIIAYILIKQYKELLGNAHHGRLKDLLWQLKTALFSPRPRPPDRSENNRQFELWRPT